MADNQYYGTGRRKSSTARVFAKVGSGDIVINKRSLQDYLVVLPLVWWLCRLWNWSI